MPWWPFAAGEDTKEKDEEESSSAEESSDEAGAAVGSTDEYKGSEFVDYEGDLIPDDYPIHCAIVERDARKLERVLAEMPKEDPTSQYPQRKINMWDHHGYTPLTLAILLKFEEGVDILLDYGAVSRVKSRDGWTSMAEAISTSQRSIVRKLVLANMRVAKEGLAYHGPVVKEHLAGKPDFYMEIDWKFVSWIPFVSRFCPSDTFKVWKRGADIRVDISLIDFENYSWKRGHVSFVFKHRKSDGEVEFHVINHSEKTRQVSTQDDEFTLDERELDDNVEALLQSELITPELLSDEVTMEQEQNWLGKPKTVTVRHRECAAYKLKNLTVMTRKKDSHVPIEVLEKRKLKRKLLKKKTKTAKIDEKAGSDEDPFPDGKLADRSHSDLHREDSHSQSTSLSVGYVPRATQPFAFDDGEFEGSEERGRSSRRDGDRERSASSRAKSPRPWDRKKAAHFEKLKKFEYPEWNPVAVSIETYFTLDTTPILESAAERAAALQKRRAKEKKDVKKAALEAKKGGDLSKKRSASFFVKKAAEEEEDEPSSSDSESSSERRKVTEKSRYNTMCLLNPAPVEVKTKTFTLNIAMVDKFGVTLEEVITILEATASQSKLAKELIDFLKMEMPPGFPIRLELPLFYVLKAIVTFDKFQEIEVKDEIFEIPEEYEVVELKEDVAAT
jgi:hypothetical protein